MQGTLTPSSKSSLITFRPVLPFNTGWNRVAGVTVSDGVLQIDPDCYFERLEEPCWSYVPWETVQANWDALIETPDIALEQACLSFIRENATITRNPSLVLANAEAVYSYLYDPAHIAQFDDLDFATEQDLVVLRETSILCALNKVDASGHITNIGPAWYFAHCAGLVYGLSTEDRNRVDELFHGGFFNGPRLRDQLKAHTALAGKLVHGCGSGNGSQAGGCVVSYGTDVEVMQRELIALRPIMCGKMGY